MFCLYRNTLASDPIASARCPVRLGRVARICMEVDPPFAVIEAWWPLLKPNKFGDRINLFGTWVKTSKPVIENSGPPIKKQATSAWSATQCLMVDFSDILVWPVDIEPGTKRYTDGARIPFSALEYLRKACGIDLALPIWTFADRGKAFYEHIMWQRHSDEQPRQ